MVPVANHWHGSGKMAKFSKGPWRVVPAIRGKRETTIRDAHGDTIALVYTNGDSRAIVKVPELLGSLKHMIAIVRMREGELRASERAKYEAARALVNELNGEH